MIYLKVSIRLSVSRTSHYARVYVEDTKAPLIDAFPSSLLLSFLPSIHLLYLVF